MDPHSATLTYSAGMTYPHCPVRFFSVPLFSHIFLYSVFYCYIPSFPFYTWYYITVFPLASTPFPFSITFPLLPFLPFASQSISSEIRLGANSSMSTKKAQTLGSNVNPKSAQWRCTVSEKTKSPRVMMTISFFWTLMYTMQCPFSRM